MLAIKIWNYLKGYVIIRINGLSLERLLNLALANSIYLWNVNRINNTEIEATLSLAGYNSLENIVNKAGCQIEIKDKIGLPFLLKKLKKRKMLGFGLIVFICLIILLSSIIWEIEIIGAEQISTKEIISLLETNNIKTGKLKKNINKDFMKDILLNEFEYISFLDIRINGVKLTIEIRESDIPPEKIDKTYPCNIIAKKRGVILKIIAKNGEAVAKKGKIVEKGEILISGVMKNSFEDSPYLVHAEGEVLARTRYTSIIEEPIVKTDKIETGRTYKQRGLKFKDKGIRFLSGDIPYENYIEEIIEKDIVNFKWAKIDIPIKIVNYTFREVELK